MKNLTTSIFLVWRSWIVRSRCNSEGRTPIATKPTLSLLQLQLFNMLDHSQECLHTRICDWMRSWKSRAMLAFRISLVRAPAHVSRRCPLEPPASFRRTRIRNTKLWADSASATSWTKMRPMLSVSKKSTKSWPLERLSMLPIGLSKLARTLSLGPKRPRATMMSVSLRARPPATSALSLSSSTVSTNRTPKLLPADYYYTYSCCPEPTTCRSRGRRTLLKRQPKNRLTGRFTTYQCTKWLS